MRLANSAAWMSPTGVETASAADWDHVPSSASLPAAISWAQSWIDVIGELAGSVLAVGSTHEELLVSGAYPQLAFAGEVPGLLSELGSADRLPAPEIALAASGWAPIGLGAIQSRAARQASQRVSSRSWPRASASSR